MEWRDIRGIAFDVDGVLSPCTIPMSEDGEPCRLLNVKDGYAIQLAVKKGLRLAIISGGRSRAVAIRYRNLGVQDVYMGATFKLPLFEQWLDDAGLDAVDLVFVEFHMLCLLIYLITYYTIFCVGVLSGRRNLLNINKVKKKC